MAQGIRWFYEGQNRGRHWSQYESADCWLMINLQFVPTGSRTLACQLPKNGVEYIYLHAITLV